MNWKIIGLAVILAVAIVAVLNRVTPGVMGNYDSLNYEGEEYQ
jgi:Flp pilus assembly pilin Flp